MAKPSGINGFFRVGMNAQGQVMGGFEQISFPREKFEVERKIVANFIASMNMHLSKSSDEFIFWDPAQNDENDFDFTVSTSRGPAYLEQMEVAPLSGPYDTAPASYKPFEFANVVLEGIKRKSERYPKTMDRDLFLLLYVTHWAFDLSNITAACLQYWTARTPHVFRAIFSYKPLDAHEGAPGWIFPFPPELLGAFNPETVRDSVCLTLDPRKGHVISERKP
jgi:hypothetical protein